MVRNGENAPDLYAHLLLAWAQRREARSGVPVVESLRRFRVRAGGDWTRGRPENGAEGFFQPLNEGVDLDAPVRAVSITPRFAGQNPKILRKRFPNEVRQAVLAEFNSPSGVVNADTGWRVGMSGADFHEHLKFSDADAVGGLAQLEAVAALPDLMRNAKLVESYQDKKNNPDIRKMHRFQAALQIGDTSYSVKLTVKEFEDGTLHIAQDNPIKLYHHRLEKEMPAGNSDTLRVPGVNQPSAGTSKYTLRQLLEDVKDSEGNIFFVADKSLHQSDPARLRQNNVTYPNNGREVGRVSPEIARTLRLDKPGSIVLDDKGLHHIEERHGKEIRGLGFANARDFVDRVLENVSAVYDVDGNGRKYDLVSRIMTPQGRVMIRLEFAQSGDYYSVATAGPMRPQYYDKKTPLWERAQSNQLQESPDAVSGQSGVLHQQQRADRQIIDTSDGGVNLRIADEDGSSPRGSITPVDEGYLIRLYDKADLSTMLHETGHFFLLEMEQDIRAGIADASTIKDLAAIRRWLGAQGDAPLTRAQHEAFARGFERYLREGKAPSRELESIFARFRQWLVHLYRKATSLDVELNDDVRAVFNRMLAAEDGFAAAPLPRQRSAASASGTVSAPAPHSAPRLREGLTRKPDSATARVVSLPEHAVPEFAGMKEFAAWLKDMLAEGGDIEIASTGQTARFTRTNVGASVKRSRSSEHRNAYAGLREMVRNAEYDHYEPADERHPNGGGQDVYYSALRMGDRLYSVKLKLDVVTESVRKAREGHGETEIEDIHYKDHKLSEIEIAPALYRDAAVKPFTQPANAISEVSLGILRGSVKPSGIDGQTLFQPAAPGPTPAGSPTRVERLKEMERPDRQRMPARQAVFRTEERNAVGVPLSRVTRIEGIVTREELDAALSALAGQDLPNLIEGVTAQVNSNQKRKMESTKAGKKSQANGFSFEEHNSVAAQIANAWKWAAEARRTGDEKHNMPDVGIRRYVSALELNGRDAFAWLTVKETPTGLRIYSVELMDEKKLRGTLGNGDAEATTTTPSGRSFEETISRLNIVVNEQRQTRF